MILEDDDSPVASIILADTDMERLIYLKKITRSLLRICRQLSLEKYLIEADVCHMDKNKTDKYSYF
jgi:hypothetical protein